MYILVLVLFLAICFCLGALPLTGLIVKTLANIDLKKVGTGNVSVAAAFTHAPKPVAITAVLAEIVRGIAPVLIAKVLFPEIVALQLAGLIFLVLGRYFIAKGGGVTNASWGVLLYSPVVALGSGITGFLILVIGKKIFPQKNQNIRQWAARLGCLGSFLWVLLFRQEASFFELFAALGLAIILVVINLRQSDDMALQKQSIFSLDSELDGKICGEKAARLAQLKKAGFNVVKGFVLPAIQAGTRGNWNREVDSSLPTINYSSSEVDKIEDKLDKMSINFPLIVRSSAVGEDSDNSSAAGQYKTIYPVKNKTELLEAINICCQSYWLPEAVVYRRQREIPDAEMAVLIQPYIISQVAGVMFTRNPLDGGAKIIIEALPGGADKVVGGQFSPVHLEIVEEGRGKKEEGRRKREEGKEKKEEGRRKREEGRGKKEEGRGKKEEGKGKKWMVTQTSTNFKQPVDYRVLNLKEKDNNQSLEEGRGKKEGGRRKEEEGRGKKWIVTQTSTNFKQPVDDRVLNLKEKDKNQSLEEGRGKKEEGRRKEEEGRGKKWIVTQTSTNFKQPVDDRLLNPKEKDNNQSLEQVKNQDILPEEVIQELVNQAEAIEAFFHGLPQDIEWCWDGEKIWILQSRPITNLRPIWTRTIAAEVIPGAIHPLTWSINRPLTCGVWGEIFTIVLGEKVAKLDFTETATLLGSHAYFNATLLGEIFRMMGLPEQGLEFLLRGQKMGKPPLGKVLPSLPGLWRLIKKEMAVDREFERDYYQIFVPALQSLENNFKQNSSQSLSELLDQAEQIQVWLKPITFYNILGPIGLAIRRSLFRVSEEWLPTDTAPEIVSIRELQKLAVKLRMATNSDGEIEAEFEQNQKLQWEFQQWLESYGYLSEVGTDIAVETWQEKPDIFRYLLLTMARKDGSKKDEVLDNTLNWWQRWRLAQCAKRARTKGKIAEVYGKLLAYLRLTFLAIEIEVKSQKSRVKSDDLEVKSQKSKVKSDDLEENLEVFEEKGDIFYLEFEEIRQLILSTVGLVEEGNSTKRSPLTPLEKGGMFEEQNRTEFNTVTPNDERSPQLRSSPTPLLPYSLTPLLRQRKEELEKDRDRLVPSVVYGNVLPKENPEIAATPENASILLGIPASVGCVEGYVKVCRSLEVNLAESENLIIVVPYTDAGWAPLLLKAKGIIAEVGGQLSHGAIIAREYGIPAVMNVSGAMTRLQDGQKVRVDGYRGTVEFI
ncbi:MAG: PEP-utilizing protein [Okeania sp. SIO3B5]|uniref:glycerol-3-phosphate acyltransferase n=1 Tax=Okeania sp. SIO3B5 TaxID=2607811 RepID=UPI001401869A|nr:glycerol-3-phosphate acyltransferase [Okeania sp. SIO3B5]NEO53822.1 PEP-utilizing protein [Okeania sp. SIO3B5]